jgi:hypothetical protein
MARTRHSLRGKNMTAFWRTAARSCQQKGGRTRPASALHAKNDVHDLLRVIEALRVQLVGHLDILVVCSGDF